jgi:hypothetical protein
MQDILMSYPEQLGQSITSLTALHTQVQHFGNQRVFQVKTLVLILHKYSTGEFV